LGGGATYDVGLAGQEDGELASDASDRMSDEGGGLVPVSDSDPVAHQLPQALLPF
jgi:hypothetical protein